MRPPKNHPCEKISQRGIIITCDWQSYREINYNLQE